jgi:hypothetical protein
MDVMRIFQGLKMKILLFSTFVFFLALVNCSADFSSSSASTSCFSKGDHRPAAFSQVESHPSGNFSESPPDKNDEVSNLSKNLKKFESKDVVELFNEFQNSKHNYKRNVIRYPFANYLLKIRKEEKSKQGSTTKDK